MSAKRPADSDSVPAAKRTGVLRREPPPPPPQLAYGDSFFGLLPVEIIDMIGNYCKRADVPAMFALSTHFAPAIDRLLPVDLVARQLTTLCDTHGTLAWFHNAGSSFGFARAMAPCMSIASRTALLAEVRKLLPERATSLDLRCLLTSAINPRYPNAPVSRCGTIVQKVIEANTAFVNGTPVPELALATYLNYGMFDVARTLPDAFFDRASGHLRTCLWHGANFPIGPAFEIARRIIDRSETDHLDACCVQVIDLQCVPLFDYLLKHRAAELGFCAFGRMVSCSATPVRNSMLIRLAGVAKLDSIEVSALLASEYARGQDSAVLVAYLELPFARVKLCRLLLSSGLYEPFSQHACLLTEQDDIVRVLNNCVERNLGHMLEALLELPRFVDAFQHSKFLDYNVRTTTDKQFCLLRKYGCGYSPAVALSRLDHRYQRSVVEAILADSLTTDRDITEAACSLVESSGSDLTPLLETGRVDPIKLLVALGKHRVGMGISKFYEKQLGAQTSV